MTTPTKEGIAPAKTGSSLAPAPATSPAGGAPPKDRAADMIALALTLLGMAWLLWMAGQSNGFYHDDDACHYTIAASSWESPRELWSQWGRPGFTIPYAVVGHFFGLQGARVFSVLLTAAMAYLSYLIARRCLGDIPGSAKIAALAPVLVYLQPLTTLLSLTTLTETPAGFYLTLGLWLFMRGNRVWGTGIFSLSFIARYELLALAPIMALAVAVEAMREKQWNPLKAARQIWPWAAVAALAIGPAIYLGAAWIGNFPPEFSPAGLFQKKYTDTYGSGDMFTYLYHWLVASGLGVLALGTAGLFSMPLRVWLPGLLSLGLTALHTIIYMRGSFESGGYARFLIPISATTAAVAACGIVGLWRYPKRAGLEAALMILGVCLFIGPKSQEYTEEMAWWWTRVSGLAHEFLDWTLPFWNEARYRSVSQGLAIALLVAAMVGIAFWKEKFRRWAGVVAVALAGSAVLLYSAGVIRPLRITDLSLSPLYPVIYDGLKDIGPGTPYADRPALCAHVVPPLLRANTRNFYARQSFAMWLESEPGTLFIWDIKHANGDDLKEHLGIWERLPQYGRLVSEADGPDSYPWIRIFARNDRPAEPSE